MRETTVPHLSAAPQQRRYIPFFTARRSASAIFAVETLSVRLSFIATTGNNLRRTFQYHMTVNVSGFCYQKLERDTPFHLKLRSRNPLLSKKATLTYFHL